LLWFLVNDRVKLLAYRIFDPVTAGPKPAAKATLQPRAKADFGARIETVLGDFVHGAGHVVTEAIDQAKTYVGAVKAPEAKTAHRSVAKAADKPEADAKVQPEAKAAPQPKADAKPEVKAAPKPVADAAPKPDAKAAPKPETKAEPQPEAHTGGAALLDRTLGDILLAGLVKDPEDAGRIIAAAITQAKAPPATAHSPDAKAAPGPDSETKAPSDVTPQAAKRHRVAGPPRR
jgi:hypothetical protein